ncbi:AAA family ATPase [Kribbella sp. NPDC050124]|uniref:helix-turn-helix transcriptional regulator n=1 Tax=Kribbella sp. NPDC050124 TaxID=3364114 RepID=UPI0037B096D1
MGARPNCGRRELRGRRDECDALDGVVKAARSGRSAVLVVRGEPGFGKSALLDYVVRAAAGCRVLQVAGVESQMELAFAGLHQLCGPLLGTLERLPDPQTEALGTALGLRAGHRPDRFLVGLATLSLLAEAAREQPLVCVVDDAHWLDQASAQTLTFVARRLVAESVALVVATRTSDEDEPWAGLPELNIRGLGAADAIAVLELAVPGPLDLRVRDRIVDETRGNPLALWELPRWLTPTELAFGPERADGKALTSRMEEGFRRQLEPLPEQSRLLLLTAAAEPLGDRDLLWRAAARLGIGTETVRPAEAAGLFAVRDTVRFRHPLVRSVVYRSASALQRQTVHQALADVTDPELDPDRRAWHRAHAASGPDEAVAAELERCASRALAHGGLAAAAALLEQAAMLTPSAADRAQRELDAAQVMAHAGRFEAALNLLAVAEYGPLSELQRARVDVCRAQIEFALNRDNEALPLLLTAARRLERLDVALALDSYADALTAAWFGGHLVSGADAVQVAHAARRAPMPACPRRGDHLLQGTAVLLTEGYREAAPSLKRAVRAFDSEDVSVDEGVRFGWLAAVVAIGLWDDMTWSRWADRYMKIVREAGALSALPLALNTRAFVDLFTGDLTAASVLVEELNAVTEAGQITMTPYAAIGLAAFRGHGAEAAALIGATRSDATARGEGIGVALTHWAQTLLCNGLGRYGEAVGAGREAAAHAGEMALSNWALVELVEAAVRAGEPATAAAAFGRLSEKTRTSGTEWALGIAARSEAQLRDGKRAEDLYREAIGRLERTLLRSELARAQLLYGEWLRRAGRRLDAREQLRAADDALTGMGMDAFVGRARRELAATGETVRKRTDDTRQNLTAQEMHIARLAAEGLSNPEIGAELFISPRTVEWHMRKVFVKLGITGRRQLRQALNRALSGR